MSIARMYERLNSTHAGVNSFYRNYCKEYNEIIGFTSNLEGISI